MDYKSNNSNVISRIKSKKEMMFMDQAHIEQDQQSSTLEE